MVERWLPVELVVASLVDALLIWRRGTRPGNRIDFARAASFLAGLGVLAVSLVGPIDVVADRALSWHMTQHLLIVSVAAPLLAIGRPVALVLEALPSPFHPRGARWRGPLRTALVGLLALATLLIWHVPMLYQAALGDPTIHIVEHASLLATSVVLWADLIDRANVGASVIWLFVLSLPVTAFGVAMTIARTPWYAHYVASSRAVAVRDQQLAGVIMWAFGGLAAVAGGVGLFAVWLVGARAPTDDRDHSTSTRDPVPTC